MGYFESLGLESFVPIDCNRKFSSSTVGILLSLFNSNATSTTCSCVLTGEAAETFEVVGDEGKEPDSICSCVELGSHFISLVSLSFEVLESVSKLFKEEAPGELDSIVVDEVGLPTDLGDELFGDILRDVEELLGDFGIAFSVDDFCELFP